MRALRSSSLAQSLAVAFILAACDDPIRPPDPGAIRVVVVPSGEDISVHGLSVRVGNAPSRQLDSGRLEVTMAGLEPGVHMVRVDGLAVNCQVAGGNPRSVTVASNDTTTAEFNIACAARVGNVRVTTATTGTDIDADGYTALVIGGPSRAVPSNGTATITNVREGTRLVTLGGLAPNCAITGADTTTVVVQLNGTSDVSFAIECVGVGQLVVTVSTSGVDLDWNGYMVDVQAPSVGFTRAVSVAANASVTFPTLRPAADYRVMLQDVAPNCVVTGPHVRTVAVTPGVTTRVTFDIVCEAARLLAIEGTDGDIYTLRSHGGGGTRLTTDPAFDGQPAWSSTGRIAFMTTRHSGDAEVYVMNENGTNPVRITTNASIDDAPSWSPDGEKLVFRSFRDVNDDDIYIVNADGTGLTRLTNNNFSDREPVWSSTGKIAFISTRDDVEGEIYVMNEDGSNVVRLTNNTMAESTPAWSPDGSMIAFARIITCYYYCEQDLYVMNVDGSNERRLATGSGTNMRNADPSWSPNGQAIAFTQQWCPYYCEPPEVRTVDLHGTVSALLAVNASNPAWKP